jgi:tripartite-type tricarboxylate transporter receptor subunit TctC
MSRVVRLFAVLIFATAVNAGPAVGQSFPSRPITLIAPFAPGGGGDIIARMLAQKMGVQVIVENRPGAGGIAATQVAAKANPDGHTLLLLSNVNAISESLFKSLPYDIFKDFIPISTAATTDVAVIVGKNSTINSLPELIQDAKTRPGRVTVGIGLLGTTQHLSAELFKSRTGLDITIIPFKSVANILTGLNSGEIDVAFELVPAAIGHIKSGNLRALAVGSKSRFAGLPQVPTVMETGIRDYEVMSWAMVAAPTRTPAPIVERLNQEILKALKQTDLQQRYQELGLTAAGGTPKEALDFLTSEVAKWRSVIRTANIAQQ